MCCICSVAKFQRDKARQERQRRRKFVRTAAGETWEDPTLEEWDQGTCGPCRRTGYSLHTRRVRTILENPGKAWKTKMPFSRPGKAWKMSKRSWKSLENESRKNCESIVRSDTLILYINKFFAPPARLSISQSDFNRCRAKNGSILHAYGYVSVYIKVKLSRLANSISLEKRHNILEKPWKSPGIFLQHVRTHPELRKSQIFTLRKCYAGRWFEHRTTY